MDDGEFRAHHHRHPGKGKHALSFGLLVFATSLGFRHLAGMVHFVYEALVGLSY